MMNQVFLRSDKGEYFPGETLCGAVYLHVCTPTEAHGVQLSFNGKESVCCDCTIDGHKTTLHASQDYVDYCNADLFTQAEPFSFGSYCFPFRLQIPHIIPGSFEAGSGGKGKSWSASVVYRLQANVLGAEAMVVAQDIIVKIVTSEELRDNHQTKAEEIRLASTSFFARKVHVTIKPLANFVQSGDCARLRMVITNPVKAHNCVFTIKLIRTLRLTLPYKPRRAPGLDSCGDSSSREETSPPHSPQLHSVLVEGEPCVVRQMTGDLSQLSLLKGGALDNIMIPLKSTDGKNIIPSVSGKYIQCDYSLEVSIRQGEYAEQTVSIPIVGVLPAGNTQWSSWDTLPWMRTAEVMLNKNPGLLSPPQQLLGSEAFGRLPRFQVL